MNLGVLILVVLLAAAVCLHIAVALELVAGQTWATPQPVQDCGTRCPGGTDPGNGPSGQLVVPPRLLWELDRFGLGRLGAPSSGSAT